MGLSFAVVASTNPHRRPRPRYPRPHPRAASWGPCAAAVEVGRDTSKGYAVARGLRWGLEGVIRALRGRVPSELSLYASGVGVGSH